MKVVVDECLPPQVAVILDTMGIPAESLRDHQQGRPDVEWLGSIASTECVVVLSADERIRRRRPEVQALRAAGVTLVLVKQRLMVRARIIAAHGIHSGNGDRQAAEAV